MLASDPLDESAREEQLLSGYVLHQPGVHLQGLTQWDEAALFSRIGAFERNLVRNLTGDLSVKVKPQVQRGNIVMPPPALTQLVREAIEWCDDTAVVDADHKPLSVNDFVHFGAVDQR